MLELESWNVGAANDFVVGVHVARCSMGLRVLDLVDLDAALAWEVFESRMKV